MGKTEQVLRSAVAGIALIGASCSSPSSSRSETTFAPIATSVQREISLSQEKRLEYQSYASVIQAILKHHVQDSAYKGLQPVDIQPQEPYFFDKLPQSQDAILAQTFKDHITPVGSHSLRGYVYHAPVVVPINNPSLEQLLKNRSPQLLISALFENQGFQSQLKEFDVVIDFGEKQTILSLLKVQDLASEFFALPPATWEIVKFIDSGTNTQYDILRLHYTFENGDQLIANAHPTGKLYLHRQRP